MKDDSTIIHLRQPGLVADPLTEIAREGAKRILLKVCEYLNAVLRLTLSNVQ